VVLKTERSALRDIRSPHSKNLSGDEDREERFKGHKKPTLEELEQC
jgi:hypothetical protein